MRSAFIHLSLSWVYELRGLGMGRKGAREKYF